MHVCVCCRYFRNVMKISLLILVSFAAVLLLFSVTTFINNRLLDEVDANTDSFSRSSAIVRQSNRFQRNYANMVSSLRGYLLTNEGSFIQNYDSAIADNERIIEELIALLPHGSEQKGLLDDIQQRHRHWENNFARPLLEAKRYSALSDSGRLAFDSLYRYLRSSGLEKEVQANVQRKFSTFINNEYGEREEQKKSLFSSVKYTRDISFYLTWVSVICGAVISVLIAYYISSRIVRMSTMANKIAQGDYSVRINERGKSELSELARTLNNMAAILQSNFSMLERQKSELDQFAHIVSHDLKAPLRGIDNVVSWIEEDHSLDLPEKVNSYLSLIKTRIVRAENLLKGILEYAHIGKEERRMEYVDVNELLMEVMDYIPSRACISLRVMPNMPLLFSERLPLLQIFINLIGNAMKYHDKGSGEIRVYCRANGRFYEFFVEDDGPGIDPNYHEKIFIIFQTLQARDNFESTGIGLAIVKKILDERNLSVAIDSQPGLGSTFRFTWPKQEFYASNYQYFIGR
jgi:signal transduction histidine kinase